MLFIISDNNILLEDSYLNYFISFYQDIRNKNLELNKNKPNLQLKGSTIEI